MSSDRANLDYSECRLELMSIRAARTSLRLRGQDVVAMDRDIAVLRQRERSLADRSPELNAHRLRERFGLSQLEDDLVWLVVSRAPAFVIVEDPAAHAHPMSVSFAASALAEVHRERLKVHQALARDGRLARSGLVRLRYVGEGERRAEVLRAPGFLPWWLAGQRVLSEELVGIAARVAAPPSLDAVALRPDTRQRVKRVAGILAPREGRPPSSDAKTGPNGYDFQQSSFVVVSGPAGSGKTMVAKALAHHLKVGAIIVDCALLASLPRPDQGPLLDLAFLEAATTGDLLVLDRADMAFGAPPPDSHLEPRFAFARLEGLLQRMPALVVATTTAGANLATSLRDRVLESIELPPGARETARELWRMMMPAAQLQAAPDIDVADIAARYTLTGRGIQNALHVVSRIDPQVMRKDALEHACEATQSGGMSETTTRVWIRRDRKDLELPDALARQIDEIIRTESIRDRVLDEWGLGRRMMKGLGLVCLFDGEPGTGKTLAAEVIASELDLPLYAVNVANVVSKWIGETEKNLQRIFDDASRNRCVLLFDEADSLFGKRTNVERSIDRFANMEINLLLQLVENHRGLVLLTTNLKDAIDAAFSRRFAFKLSFEFPDAETRQRIWRRLLPKDKLAPDVDIPTLAETYELSGGSIRSIVLRAAYRAASEGHLLDMAALDDCATVECKSLGRLVRWR
ncbi:MAG: ATP-binding protein [Myxococcota bacterium]